MMLAILWYKTSLSNQEMEDKKKGWKNKNKQFDLYAFTWSLCLLLYSSQTTCPANNPRAIINFSYLLNAIWVVEWDTLRSSVSNSMLLMCTLIRPRVHKYKVGGAEHRWMSYFICNRQFHRNQFPPYTTNTLLIDPLNRKYNRARRLVCVQEDDKRIISYSQLYLPSHFIKNYCVDMLGWWYQ